MLIVEIRGDQVWRRVEGQGSGAALPAPALPGRPPEAASPDVLTSLADWAQRYGRAAAVGSETALRGIGEEIFAWLDQGGALDKWLARPERALEIQVDPARPGPLAEAPLAAPWETLCRNGGFLAEEVRLFVVSRRCGGTDEPAPAQHSDISLMFMAAAPDGQSDLDYEAEEAAILEATKAKDGRAPLAHVQVEESGALKFLADRMRLDGPFEALHLSCHGDILASRGQAPSPVLFLETAEGDDDPVAPERLISELANGIPPLVFVSACRTAERGVGRKGIAPAPEGYRVGGVAEWPVTFDTPADRRDAGGTDTGTPVDLAEPFVRQLAVHAPNVLGWDGSVFDRDATLFAEALYGELARVATVPQAAARARRALFAARAEDPRLGRHWHLARVYLGPGGGGALCDPACDPRPVSPGLEKAFLDKKNKLVPVATRAEFVGRRRQIQAVLAAFRSGRKGVLIHGMGNLGKSSLAARVAARLPRHRTAVVVGECHALAVLAALKGAVEEVADGMPRKKATQLLDEVAEIEKDVAENDRALDGVRPLLRGTLNIHPVLLVLDDLEQSLETPSADRREVQPAAGYRDALVAVFTAFEKAATASRLLLTSRYDFVLPDGAGNDLAAGLARVPLAPMRPRERLKQVRAKARAEGREEAEAAASEMIDAALAAAAGNPGLQDTLTRPILAGEDEAAKAAIATVEAFRATGAKPPADEDPGDFFRRMAFGTYTGALSDAEKAALSAATLFSEDISIPRRALEAAAAELGLADPARALDRLLALGLLDDWGEMAAGRGAPKLPHAAANPFARPLADPLSEDKRVRLARAALPALLDWLADKKGDVAAVPLSEEAIKLAVLIGEPKSVARCARAAAQSLRRRVLSLDRIAETFWLWMEAHDGILMDPLFMAEVTEALRYSGHANVTAATLCLEYMLDAFENRLAVNADIEQCGALMILGTAFENRFDYARAGRAYRNFERRALQLGRRDAAAMAASLSARVISETGDNKAAVAAHQEAVRLHEQAGDLNSIATARLLLADAILKLPNAAEAKRILEEDVLPAYEALDDRSSVAYTRGKIAEILTMEGEFDEARRIREEEELPAYEALGDRRGVAFSKGKIAGILGRQGELDGALAMHLERLPIAQEMKDLDTIAHIRISCAQIRLSRGDHKRGGIQTILEELREAYVISLELQRRDFIGTTGFLLGRVLALGGHADEAVGVLETATAALEKMGEDDTAAQCHQLIEQIRGGTS